MLQSKMIKVIILTPPTHSPSSALEKVTHLDMALSSQVINLRGFDCIDDLHQAGAVCEIPIVQLHVFRV